MKIDRIKQMAKKQGLSLKETAMKSGIGENSIYRWQKQTPTTSSIQKVADTLHVSVDYLLGNTDEINPNTSVIPSEESLDRSLDRSIAYDGTEITDHDRIIIKAMLNAYFENKNK